MTDITTQPTEPIPAATDPGPVSQATLDEIRAAINDPEVQAVVHTVPEVIKETKAGYKTTEFWLTIAGLAAVNLNGVVMTLPDKYQAIGTAVIAGLYALSRGQAKKGIPSIESGTPEA